MQEREVTSTQALMACFVVEIIVLGLLVTPGTKANIKSCRAQVRMIVCGRDERTYLAIDQRAREQ